MKKLIIISLLLVINFGCQQSESNDVSDFQKKETCLSHREEANNKVAKLTKGAYGQIDDIFYSPKLDTCIFTYGECYEGRCELFVFDFYTTKMIDSIDCQELCEPEIIDFNKRLGELKQ